MKVKILIVDDEQLVLDFWEKVFLKEGYSVQCATSAETALEILKKQAFNIFFIDIGLPGMNGVDLFRQIKPERSKSMFFAMTGLSSEYDLAKCRAIGFDDFFEKPFEVSQVKDFVRDSVKRLRRWGVV